MVSNSLKTFFSKFKKVQMLFILYRYLRHNDCIPFRGKINDCKITYRLFTIYLWQFVSLADFFHTYFQTLVTHSFRDSAVTRKWLNNLYPVYFVRSSPCALASRTTCGEHEVVWSVKAVGHLYIKYLYYDLTKTHFSPSNRKNKSSVTIFKTATQMQM